MSENTHPDMQAKGPSFFSIFLIVGRLLWVYGKRLFNLDTLASLEKKQGGGNGQKSEEHERYEQALERNTNNYHFTDEQLGPRSPKPIIHAEEIVLYVKGGQDK